MGAPSPPPVPDPTKVAAAQTASNKETAIAQSNLNSVNQITPQGTQTYQTIGTNPDGTPIRQLTTAYSPDQQALYDKTTQAQNNLGDIAVTQSQKIGDLLNTPFQLDQATQDNISQRQASLLDPQIARQQEALRTQLVNSGANIGSKAYTNAMTDFNNQSQQSRDQNYLDSYNAAQQSALTQRNQPINEISALMSGSQVSQPSFGQVANTGVAPTDVTGAYALSQNAANSNYQAQVANQGSMLGGLFGLGKAALGGWSFSDERMKKDIKHVGHLNDGTNLYKYRYKGEPNGGLMQMGVLAQEVEKTHPEAVIDTDSGMKMVNYSAIAEALG